MNKVNNDCSEKGTVIICDTGGSRSRIADESSGESLEEVISDLNAVISENTMRDTDVTAG